MNKTPGKPKPGRRLNYLKRGAWDSIRPVSPAAFAIVACNQKTGRFQLWNAPLPSRVAATAQARRYAMEHPDCYFYVTLIVSEHVNKRVPTTTYRDEYSQSEVVIK